MNERVRQYGSFALALVGAILCAYGLGKVAADYSSDDSTRQYLSARSYNTGRLVAQMNTVQVGGLVPDHSFVSLEGNRVLLSEMLQPRTLLFFFDPGCPSCLGQMEMIVRVASSTAEQARFLIISRAERWQLEQVRSDLGVKCRILWDSAGVFHDNLNIHSSPLGIIVNKKLLIVAIVSGSFLEEEMIEIAHFD